MKKFFSKMSTVIIVLLAISILIVVIPKFLGIQYRAVLTASMEPEIPVGSLVIIFPAKFEDIQIGDDISFVRDKNLTVVTHRVIEKNSINKTFITQGISNNTADAPTSNENVLGIVKFKIPKLGYPIMWLTIPSVRYISIAIISSLVIISLFFGGFQKKKTNAVPKESQS